MDKRRDLYDMTDRATTRAVGRRALASHKRRGHLREANRFSRRPKAERLAPCCEGCLPNPALGPRHATLRTSACAIHSCPRVPYKRSIKSFPVVPVVPVGEPPPSEPQDDPNVPLLSISLRTEAARRPFQWQKATQRDPLVGTLCILWHSLYPVA